MFALHPPQSESVTFDDAGRTVLMVERNRNYVVGGPVCVDWVTTGRILEEFGGDRHRYRTWVEAGRGEKPVDPFERAVAGLALGGEEFTRRLVHFMRAAVSGEEPSARQLP